MLSLKTRIVAATVLLILCASTCVIRADETVRLDFSPPPLFEILGKQEKMRLICPRADAPPKIDGMLDDAAWRRALEMPRLSKTGPMTRVLLCFDEKAIYIAFQCAEQPGREPVAQKAARDWRPWSDDIVEVWFSHGRRKGQSYRFVVNPAGTIYDAIMKNRARYSEYNPDWTVAVKRTPEMWTVEAAVPLKALELTSWPRVMGFNVGRTMPGLMTASWVEPFSDTQRGVLALGRSRAEQEEPAPGARRRQTTPARPLALEFDRGYCRPGERWLEGIVRVRSDRAPLRKLKVRARLFPLGATKHVAETSVAPSRGEGRLAVDLRAHGLERARLSVELLEGRRRVDVAEQLLTVRAPEQPLRKGQRIPISIDLPPGVDQVEDWPVRFGVAFARGALWDANRVRLVDGNGREIPSQREVTGRWAPDGAIKWLRFDALVASADGYRIEATPSGRTPQPRRPVRVRQDGDDVVVDTGAATYRLGRGASPIKQVSLKRRTVATAEGVRGLYVIDQKGRLASASAEGESMIVEAEGPVAACVRFEGEYRTAEGEPLARHITRVEAFAGQAAARVTHTLVLSRDSNEVWFKDIGWELKAAPGAQPEAIFGVSHEKWAEALSRSVGAAPVYMMQDDHFALGSGKNHFLVSAEGGKDKPYLEGEECGDWAALLGRDAGLLVSCRDAALQHPKEFMLAKDRIVLRLFSGRAGAELDFRSPSLVKRWRLAEWYKRIRKDPAKIPELVKQVSGFTSNAIGWAKTHHILLSPVAPGARPDALARISRMHSRDVFATPDPAYLCGTRVFGDFHPRDATRFPVLEALIDQPLEGLMSGVRGWDLGFVDYFAGPHYQGTNLRRYSITYTLRGNLWQTYARTGRRALREFLMRSEQSFMDNYYCHWDGAGKTRGLRVMQGGDSWYGTGKGALPMYWDGFPVFGVGGTTNRQNFIWMYQLTGERRAKDSLMEFADGAKRYWTPSHARHSWRQLKTMMVLMQAYAFTWDPTLRAMADASADTFIDMECDLGLTKNRPYRSSTYKLPGDLTALIDAWDVTGAPRYHDLARRSAEWGWYAVLGYRPIHHSNTFARTGSFLYRESRDPSIPQTLAIQLSRLRAGFWDPAKRRVSAGYGASGVTFVYEGIPYSQKLLVESGADKDVVASWAGFKMLRDPVSIVARKAEEKPLRVHLRRFGGLRHTGAAGGTRVLAVGLTQALGQNLNTVTDTSNDFTEVRIPKDSEGAAYEIIPKE